MHYHTDKEGNPHLKINVSELRSLSAAEAIIRDLSVVFDLENLLHEITCLVSQFNADGTYKSVAWEDSKTDDGDNSDIEVDCEGRHRSHPDFNPNE